MFALFSIVLIIAQAYTYCKSINAQYTLLTIVYIVNRHTQEIDVYYNQFRGQEMRQADGFMIPMASLQSLRRLRQIDR